MNDAFLKPWGRKRNGGQGGGSWTGEESKNKRHCISFSKEWVMVTNFFINLKHSYVDEKQLIFLNNSGT